MSFNTPDVSTQNIAVTGIVTDIQQQVKVVRDDAIRYAVSKLPAASQDEDLLTLGQRQDFLSYLKCGLAKGVGDLLSQNDEQIKAVYLFEPDANPDLGSSFFDSLDATVHLLLLVEIPSAALESLIAALDRALTQSLKELGLAVYAEYRSVLDVVPVTDKDVKTRRGFGALLNSIFTPPIRVC